MVVPIKSLGIKHNLKAPSFLLLFSSYFNSQAGLIKKKSTFVLSAIMDSEVFCISSNGEKILMDFIIGKNDVNIYSIQGIIDKLHFN